LTTLTRKLVKDQKGEAAGTIVIICMFMVFVLLPIGSLLMEKYIFALKEQKMRDSLDITSTATYMALSSQQGTVANLTYDNSKLQSIFNQYLAANLSLNSDLTPLPSSIADGKVIVNSVIIYSGPFPQTTPQGKTVNRLTVHTDITVPVKPHFYMSTILNALGLSAVPVRVVADTEVPVNK